MADESPQATGVQAGLYGESLHSTQVQQSDLQLRATIPLQRLPLSLYGGPWWEGYEYDNGEKPFRKTGGGILAGLYYKQSDLKLFIEYRNKLRTGLVLGDYWDLEPTSSLFAEYYFESISLEEYQFANVSSFWSKIGRKILIRRNSQGEPGAVNFAYYLGLAGKRSRQIELGRNEADMRVGTQLEIPMTTQKFSYWQFRFDIYYRYFLYDKEIPASERRNPIEFLFTIGGGEF